MELIPIIPFPQLNLVMVVFTHALVMQHFFSENDFMQNQL